MKTHRAVIAIAMMAAIVVLGGCAAMRQSRASAEEGLVIEVQNQSFPDVVMYVVPTGDPWRIGSVIGNSTATFKLPARMVGVGQLQLLARPLAGRAYLLPAVTASPGDTVVVTIGNVAAQSTVTIAPR